MIQRRLAIWSLVPLPFLKPAWTSESSRFTYCWSLAWRILMEPKQKQYPVVDVTGDGSKVWCCKEQYCIGTWNVRSINQGKLEVVKQEMAWVNVDILGISELTWTGMGEFKSDDHCIYYCGQKSLRRNGVAVIVNKRVRNAVLRSISKNDKMVSVRFQGKPFSIMVIQSIPWAVMLKKLKLSGSVKTCKTL